MELLQPGNTAYARERDGEGRGGDRSAARWKKGTKKREIETCIGDEERERESGEGKSKSWLFRGLKLICMESTAKRLSCRLDFVLIRRQIARVRSCVYSV